MPNILGSGGPMIAAPLPLGLDDIVYLVIRMFFVLIRVKGDEGEEPRSWRSFRVQRRLGLGRFARFARWEVGDWICNFRFGSGKITPSSQE